MAKEFLTALKVKAVWTVAIIIGLLTWALSQNFATTLAISFILVWVAFIVSTVIQYQSPPTSNSQCPQCKKKKD